MASNNFGPSTTALSALISAPGVPAWQKEGLWSRSCDFGVWLHSNFLCQFSRDWLRFHRCIWQEEYWMSTVGLDVMQNVKGLFLYSFQLKKEWEDSVIANCHGLNSEANKASSESDSLPLLLVKTKMSQFTTTVMRAWVGMKGGGDVGLLHAWMHFFHRRD